MFRVFWLQTVLNELASIWLPADAETRKAISALTQALDLDLQTHPLGQGESQQGNERILLVPPLGLTYEVLFEKSLVRILHAWDMRRNP